MAGDGTQQVLGVRPPARLAVSGDEAGVFQLAQALAEGLRSDPAVPVHQVGEPLAAGGKVADHRQAPPVTQLLESAGAQASVVVDTNVPCHLGLILVDRYYL
jgi:hypothetical protein